MWKNLFSRCNTHGVVLELLQVFVDYAMEPDTQFG